MIRKLILMRHAKSGWDDPELADHDRTLNARGRRDADAIGTWLRDSGHVPDQVMCSSSVRTRETCALVDMDTESEAHPELYNASAAQIIATLRRAKGDCVMIVGHNPGIAEVAEALLISPPDHPAFHRYPTCSTLIAEFQIPNWSKLEPQSGAYVDFIVPRDLAARQS